jgi:hypothetical protein
MVGRERKQQFRTWAFCGLHDDRSIARATGDWKTKTTLRRQRWQAIAMNFPAASAAGFDSSVKIKPTKGNRTYVS